VRQAAAQQSLAALYARLSQPPADERSGRAFLRRELEQASV